MEQENPKMGTRNGKPWPLKPKPPKKATECIIWMVLNTIVKLKLYNIRAKALEEMKASGVNQPPLGQIYQQHRDLCRGHWT